MAINRKSVTRTRGGEKGMSLVELLIAVSVMCIAVLAIYSALVSAQCMSRSAKEDNISSFELQSIVEDVRSTPFEEILEEYDVVVFSDVESKNFQLDPSFFDRRSLRLLSGW